MSFVMQASGLGKQYGRRWALRDLSVSSIGLRIASARRPTAACRG